MGRLGAEPPLSHPGPSIATLTCRFSEEPYGTISPTYCPRSPGRRGAAHDERSLSERHFPQFRHGTSGKPECSWTITAPGDDGGGQLHRTGDPDQWPGAVI